MTNHHLLRIQYQWYMLTSFNNDKYFKNEDQKKFLLLHRLLDRHINVRFHLRFLTDPFFVLQ
jgi:hypothetical protein